MFLLVKSSQNEKKTKGTETLIAGICVAALKLNFIIFLYIGKLRLQIFIGIPYLL